MMRRVLVGILVLGLFLPSGVDLLIASLRPAQGSAGDCAIVSVTDGDTVAVECTAQTVERVRLVGFDTPEKSSPQCVGEWIAAVKATWHLRWLLFRATAITYELRGTDRYGRLLWEVQLDRAPLAGLMNQTGFARSYAGKNRESWCD
jgi:endonuclease YncB( thermonuclease family)